MNTQKLSAYFKRIQYSGSTEPCLETLRTIHERHVFSIPFEGMNAWLHQPVFLDIESIFTKLVYDKRGGYCYEMNALLYSVLIFLGFEVKLHLAEVVYDGKAFHSRPARHAILIVTFDKIDYLADVGYGRNGLIHPLSLASLKPVKSFSSRFELIYQKNDGVVFQFDINGTFKPEYRFDYPLRSSLTIDDLLPHNKWTLTSTESSFIQHAIITIPTVSGRISLVDTELRIIQDGRVEKVQVESLETYLTILEEKFDIQLDSDSVRLLADKLGFHQNICMP